MITEGKWLVSSSTIVCDEGGHIIANCCPVGISDIEVSMEDAIDNAHLIAASKLLLAACKEGVKRLNFVNRSICHDAKPIFSDIEIRKTGECIIFMNEALSAAEPN